MISLRLLFDQEVDIGLAADIGTLTYLPKITANHSLARELAYTSRFFSASEALSLGLLSKVVNGGREEVIREAFDLAKVIAGKSPVAVAGTKRLISHARDNTYVVALFSPCFLTMYSRRVYRVAESLEYTSVWNSAAVQTKVCFPSLLPLSIRFSFDLTVCLVSGHPRNTCCDEE